MKGFSTFLALVIGFSAMGGGKKPISKDTVIIEIGNGSKMVIMTETLQDLKELSDYDFNQMIGELNAGLDTANQDLETLSIAYDDDDTDSLSAELTRKDDSYLEYYGEEAPKERRLSLDESSTTVDESDELSYFEKRGITRNESRNVRNKSRKSGSSSAFELQFGMSNWLEDDKFPDESNQLYTVSPWGSWYLGAGVNTKTQLVGVWVLQWGADLSWQIWKFENKRVRPIKTEDELVFVEDMNFDAQKSRFNAAYFNMSLVPMIDFNYGKGNSRLRFGAGGYVGYRIDSWSKFIYKDDGDKVKDKTKSNFHMNNIRYGIRAQVGYKGIDFFTNYDLSPLFIKDKGPELQAISFGVIL